MQVFIVAEQVWQGAAQGVHTPATGAEVFLQVYMQRLSYRLPEVQEVQFEVRMEQVWHSPVHF